MKKVLLLAVTLMVMATGCSREVYINKQSEIIREKDTSSDVRIIDRDKQIYVKESEKVREKETPAGSPPQPASDSEYQTVVD